MVALGGLLLCLYVTIWVCTVRFSEKPIYFFRATEDAGLHDDYPPEFFGYYYYNLDAKMNRTISVLFWPCAWLFKRAVGPGFEFLDAPYDEGFRSRGDMLLDFCLLEDTSIRIRCGTWLILSVTGGMALWNAWLWFAYVRRLLRAHRVRGFPVVLADDAHSVVNRCLATRPSQGGGSAKQDECEKR